LDNNFQVKALLISSALPLTGNGVKRTPNLYEGMMSSLPS
jgi:hypothetical protein